MKSLNKAESVKNFKPVKGSKSTILALMLFLAIVRTDAGELKPFRNFTFDAPPRKVRVIDFPKDFSLGEIAVGDSFDIVPESTPKGAARGRVVVPAGKYTWFVPAGNFYKNPALIKTINPAGIDRLSIAFSSLDDSEDQFCDRALNFVGHLKGVISLDLDRSDASDEGAKHAADLPNLQKFGAFMAMLNGSCLKSFSVLKNLRWIDLQGNRIIDDNVKYLAEIPNLQYLSLSQNPLTDKGVKDLAKCRKLVFLELGSQSKITDASVDTIASLSNLRILKLHGTSITVGGILRLKHLPLIQMLMPVTSYSDYDMKRLHAAFPNTQFFFAGGKRKVDDFTKEMFAPLH